MTGVMFPLILEDDFAKPFPEDPELREGDEFDKILEEK